MHFAVHLCEVNALLVKHLVLKKCTECIATKKAIYERERPFDKLRDRSPITPFVFPPKNPTFAKTLKP